MKEKSELEKQLLSFLGSEKEKELRDLMNKPKNKDVVPQIKNLLTPFWFLTYLMTIKNEEPPKGEHFKLIQREVEKCVANKDKIIELLNSIL